MQITQGKNRIVIILKRFVIKIPSINLTCCGATKGIFAMSKYSFMKNLKSNYTEYKVYKKYGKKYKELCPVWFSLFGLLNIMPKCEPNTEFVSNTMIKYYRTLLNDNTLSQTYNVGRYNGKFVIYDYGNAII
ncbi:MAG: hypothetical protein LBC92_04520 [Rickettsiales bacterium]|jgi:hypothetical protein|nr:hypothetical protein [Rickettsiales bacterium]